MTKKKTFDAADAQALKILSMIGERWPENRSQRSETQILDEQHIVAWGLREFSHTGRVYDVLYTIFCPHGSMSDRTDKLFRWVKLPYVPAKDMDLEYEEDWGLTSIRYIYAMLDGKFEVGLTERPNAEEVAELLKTGHWSHDALKHKP